MKINNLSKLMACLLLTVGASLVSAQTQKGGDIDGEFAGDASGYSVSMPDLNTVAIGSTGNDDTGTDAGQVRIYNWNGSAWIQKGSDINGDAAGDKFGHSVSMSDSNTIAIGAIFRNGSSPNAGYVRIFSWDGSDWIQRGIDIVGQAANDQFGNAVSMSDSNTIAVGASGNDASGSNAGQVQIYSWNGNVWLQKGIDIDGEGAGDFSGSSVTMSDSNTVAIGAIGNGAIGFNSGHVRIYRWNGAQWIQKGMDIDGEASQDFSGCSVSMSDSNTIAIGAYGNDSGGSNSGHVRIYSWNGAEWIQKGSEINGEAPSDFLGASVSMPNENTVAVGAKGNDGAGSGVGQVRIYSWNGNAWLQKGVSIYGQSTGDNAGNSVSMGDSNTVAIGSYLSNSNGLGSGQVRVYCYPTLSTINVAACNSYLSPSGDHTWTVSNTYTDVVANSAGCDSIITINLTITTIELSVIQNGPQLTTNESGASYQWLNCPTMTEISGATSQSYTAITNGEFAVAITKNGCSDTSACYVVAEVGLIGNDFDNGLLIYPNPAKDELNIQFLNGYHAGTIRLLDLTGKELVLIENNLLSQLKIDISNVSPGMYLMQLTNDSGAKIVELIKQ